MLLVPSSDIVRATEDRVEAATKSETRSDGRKPDELRPYKIETDYLKAPLGSALVRAGETWVLCTASVDEQQPPFLRAQRSQSGWVTAEYSMLPGSTKDRAGRGPNGRSKEIERLIGRSLRAAVDRKRLGARTVTIDCDVLQADGGTRTAAITGGYVALALALRGLRERGLLTEDPLLRQVAAISVGVVDGEPLLDLCYEEDSRAAVDMNVVVAASPQGPRFVELQGTGEHDTFDRRELDALCDLALGGARDLFTLQSQVLAQAGG